VLAVATVTALLLMRVMGSIEDLLKGMRIEGQSAYGLQSISSIHGSVTRALDGVGTWYRYSRLQGAEGTATGLGLSGTEILLDLAFIAAYVIAGLIAFRMAKEALRRWRQHWEGQRDSLKGKGATMRGVVLPAGLAVAVRWHRSQAGTATDELRVIEDQISHTKGFEVVATVWIWLLGVLAVVDLVEDIFQWVVVRTAWAQWQQVAATTSPGQVLTAPKPSTLGNWPVVLSVAAAAKHWMVLFLLLISVLLAFALSVRYSDRLAGLGRVAHRMRANLVLLVLLAVTLLYGPVITEQLDDVIRRWNGWHVLFAVVATALLTMIMWSTASSWWANKGDEAAGPLSANERYLVKTKRGRVIELLIWIAALILAVTKVAFALLVVVIFVAIVRIAGMFVKPPPKGKRLRRLLLGRLPDEEAQQEAASASQATPAATQPATASPPFGAFVFPALAAAFMPVVVGFAVIAAIFPDLLFSEGWKHLTSWSVGSYGLLALAVVLVYGSLPIWYRLARAAKGEWKGDADLSLARGMVLPVVVVVLVAATYLAIGVDVWLFAKQVGSLALLLLFGTAVLLLLHVMVVLAQRYSAPPAICGIGFRHTPIVGLLVVWLIAGSLMQSGDYHDIRIDPAQQAAGGDELRGGVTLHRAFCRWLEVNRLPATDAGCLVAATTTGNRTGAIPLILVAAPGGGIKAAYWTALALRCIFEQTAPSTTSTTPPAMPCKGGDAIRDTAVSDELFAASGVSGGSVGLAEYAAYLSQKTEGGSPPISTTDWVRDRLGEDYLAASLAWMTFVDFPRNFIGFRPPLDAAGVLEKAFEDSWADRSSAKDPSGPLSQGLKALWSDSHIPLLMLNGSSVSEGCRFEISLLNASVSARLNADETSSPGNCLSNEPFDRATVPANSFLTSTRQLVDYLCGDQDIALSTAGLLSARFPYVSPSGRLTACLADRPAGQSSLHLNVVDGGYFDDSGDSPLTEMLPDLNREIEAFNAAADGACVVPFMVQIDNGYQTPAGPVRDPKPPNELLVPPLTIKEDTGLSGENQHMREELALQFQGGYDTAHGAVTLDGSPLPTRYVRLTPQAHPGSQAPLGWVLSKQTMDDLFHQLNSGSNVDGMNRIRDWLSSDLKCPGQ
jgi:hypothetical protein